MKKYFPFIGTIAILLFACQTDELTYTENGERAIVSVAIFADTPGTRATNPGTSAERKIHSLEVWLFANNQTVGHKRFLAADLVPGANGTVIAKGIESTSGARSMVVVANHPSIGSITRSALQNLPLNRKPMMCPTYGLTMTSTEVFFDLERGENFFGETPTTITANHINEDDPENLQLVRNQARVGLINVTFDNNMDVDNRFNRFELHTVTMFNVRSTSRLFGDAFSTTASLVPSGTATFVHGANYPSPLDSYRGNLFDDILQFDLIEEKKTMSDIADNPIFFYPFENYGDPNRANRNGTFIVLKGKLLNDDEQFELRDVITCAAGYTYYAIWINDAAFGGNGGNRIRRNTQYNLTINIFGAGNPSIDPAQKAYLDVQIEVAEWIEVTQDVDWGTPPPNRTDVGVIINGTRWATRNVAAFGTFVDNPHDAGMLFQWNSNTAWSATDPKVSIPANATWQTETELAGDAWNNGRGPCPIGWRLPTTTELFSLRDYNSVWTTQNGVKGRLFGTPSNQIFLPASGFRINTDGTLEDVDNWGLYWASQGAGIRAWHLQFNYDDKNVNGFINRACGLSVRCVAN